MIDARARLSASESVRSSRTARASPLCAATLAHRARISSCGATERSLLACCALRAAVASFADDARPARGSSATLGRVANLGCQPHGTNALLTRCVNYNVLADAPTGREQGVPTTLRAPIIVSAAPPVADGSSAG